MSTVWDTVLSFIQKHGSTLFGFYPPIRSLKLSLSFNAALQKQNAVTNFLQLKQYSAANDSLVLLVCFC